MANELFLWEDNSGNPGTEAVRFWDGTDYIYPSEDTFQDNYLITHLPTLDGKGILQKKTNDYRLFTVTFPALTNTDFSAMLTALDTALYTTSEKEYYFGTDNPVNYALPDTCTFTGGFSGYKAVKVRLVNIEKIRIPNSYQRKIFNLILTFQRVG